MAERKKNIRLICLRFLIVALLPVFLPAGLFGDVEKDPAQRVPRLSGAIVVDGIIAADEWRDALMMPLPLEVYPGRNIPAFAATECYLTYDRQYLYVAFRAHDAEPEKIRAHLNERDNIDADDRIGITIDTFNDQRRGYLFYCNPYGVQSDAFRDDYASGSDSSWDAIWQSAGRLTQNGFEIEMAIPFDQIRFQETDGEQTWGFTAIRVMPRSTSYEFATQPLDFYVREYFNQFSKISGFSGVREGAHMQVTPTLTAVGTDTRVPFPGGDVQSGPLLGNWGMTGRWAPSSDLTISGTINPDFSNIEADVAQLDVNINTALFYPEKRPFFMEGASNFETPLDIVYTRMLADPNWGVKLSQRDDAQSIGLLAVGDEQTTLIVPGNQSSFLTTLERASTTTIGRYRHTWDGQSTVGAIATDRRGDGYRNSVAGIDGVWYLNDSDSFTMQLLGSNSNYDAQVAAQLGGPEGEFSDTALRLSFNHSSRTFNYFAFYDNIGTDFRADAGYINRVGVKQYYVGSGYTFWMDRDSPLIAHNYWMTWLRYEDAGGNTLYDGWHGWVNARGPWQSNVTFDLYKADQWYGGENFDLLYHRFSASFRPLNGVVASLTVYAGDGIDFNNVQPGTRLSVTPYLAVRLGHNLALSWQHDFERFSRDAGRVFEANLSQVRASWYFDERSFLRLTAQYYDVTRDSVLYRTLVMPTTRSLFLQALYRYTINPQTVLFLGYSDTALGSDTLDLTTSARTIFVKLGYAWIW